MEQGVLDRQRIWEVQKQLAERGQAAELDRGHTYAPKFSGARTNDPPSLPACLPANEAQFFFRRYYAREDSAPDFPTHIQYRSTALFCSLVTR